jgi:hypothetical protein
MQTERGRLFEFVAGITGEDRPLVEIENFDNLGFCIFARASGSKLNKPFASFVAFRLLRGPLPLSTRFPGSPQRRNSPHRKPGPQTD